MCAKYFKHFKCINLLKPHINLVMWVHILMSQMRKLKHRRLGNSPKVAQLTSGKTGILPLAVWLQSLCS